MVTGASGFVGRQAVASLRASGHSVVAVGRRHHSDVSSFIEADLLVPKAAEAIAAGVYVDALLHLAWTTHHGSYWNDLANLEWLSSTVELVIALAKQGTSRICVAGTCFEYDWPECGDCDEARTRTASHTLYDAAKTSCHRVLIQVAKQMGLSLSWGRLFYLYGPGEHPDRLVASVCRSMVAGDRARCSSGNSIRDFMDVRDAGAALANLVVSSLEGPINVASGEAVPIRDIALTIGQLAERPDLVALGEIPDRAGEPKRITASIERLRSELGFVPARSLQFGLNDALIYWSTRQEYQ